jgi:dienelactone hydrolase
MFIGGRGASLVVALAIALTLGACSSGTTTTTAPAATVTTTTTTVAPTNLAVTRITETFVDRSRPTEDPDHVRSAPARTLVTDLYVPAGAGPYPLIVHAHGADGDAHKYSEIARARARHGYVVAIPNFPLTNDLGGVPSVIGDYVNQPADLHFVLDQVLRLEATPRSPLAGKIDAEHIGASGLSLGGATTYGFAFNSCCRDPRIDAVIIMSGIKLPFDDDPYVFDRPLLVMHGTDDPVLKYPTAVTAYAAAAPPKYFVTLHGAGHAPPYENTPDPHDAVVIATTLDFWNYYLKGVIPARARMLQDAAHPPLSSIESSP